MWRLLLLPGLIVGCAPAALPMPGLRTVAVETPRGDRAPHVHTRVRVGVRYPAVLRRVYAARENRPLFVYDGRLTAQGERAAALFEDVASHGLSPADYPPAAGDDPAAFELALAENAVRYALDFRHLERFHMARALLDDELSNAPLYFEDALVADLIALGEAPAEGLRSWWPRHPDYARLRRALTTDGDGDRLRRALQRWREAPRAPDGLWIRVNIPAFELMVYRGLEAVSRHRVIVGHATREAGGVFYSRTPQLVDRMTRIDLNPRWRVPSGILKLELDKQSAAWRKRRRYRIYGQGARRRAIQLPGPANVMGRAKFVLANKRGIFLHDTKDRYMFEWKDRARSHGCIRVDGAERLARMLIEQDTPGPDPLIDEALRGWKTTSWELSRPIPVVIDYNTVVVDADGTVRIVEDVYGWDQPGAMAALRTVRFAAKQRRRALRRRLERAGESTVQRRQAIR